MKKILQWVHKFFYQYLGNELSRGVGFLVYLKGPKWLVRAFINIYFVRILKVNLAEALHEDLGEYRRVIDFFVREVKPKLRPVAKGALTIASPCDGKVLTTGKVLKNGSYIVKGREYRLEELLPKKLLPQPPASSKTKSPKSPKRSLWNAKNWQESGASFIGGDYSLVYLSPRDCHRIYAPLTGQLVYAEEMKGALYPVKESFLGGKLDVFGINKKMRLVFLFKGRLMVMIWVGAFNVGTFQTTFDTTFYKTCTKTSTGGQSLRYRDYSKEPRPFKVGAELGAFELGSSVLLFFERGAAKLNSRKGKEQLLWGEAIGQQS